MIIVQTTKRPGNVDYLDETLAQVDAENVGRRKIIYSDGPLRSDFVRPMGWEIVQDEVRRGARSAGWACMRLALERGVEDLILLQDDLEICDDGVAVMDEIQVPKGCIAATFYTSVAVLGLRAKEPGEPRIIIVPACGTAQALKFPRAALERVTKIDPCSAPNVPPLELHLFDDSLFSIARTRTDLPCVAQVVPNPVKHRGAVSACGSTNPHRPPWSVGRGQKFPANPRELPLQDFTRREEVGGEREKGLSTPPTSSLSPPAFDLTKGT